MHNNKAITICGIKTAAGIWWFNVLSMVHVWWGCSKVTTLKKGKHGEA